MRLFGLIGYPLAHSRSQDYFRERFKRDHRGDCDYLPFPLHSIDEFPTLLRKHPSLVGVNVTIPYKETIIPYLDSISPEANRIGAVNVLLIKNINGTLRIEGHNTDAQGFLSSLPERCTFRRALVLGTGGASKAVCFALNLKGIECVKVGRTPVAGNVISYADLEKNFQDLAKECILINTTPLGMYPETSACPPIPYALLDDTMFLYDLIYNPPVTLFLSHAKEKGVACQNGEQMFLNQAELAYQLFLKDKT